MGTGGRSDTFTWCEDTKQVLSECNEAPDISEVAVFCLGTSLMCHLYQDIRHRAGRLIRNMKREQNVGPAAVLELISAE